MGKIIFIIALAIIAVVFGPLATIWALNTLFPVLDIPTTLETWMAAFLVNAVVSGQGLGFSFKK